ncbi:MAG: 16S rRNA (guanine(527)-N(7))-methyltransferase RsmG [Acidobacteriaceae bacterium]
MTVTADQVLAAAERWELSQTLSRTESAAEKLAAYGNLLLHWNARLSLTAIRDKAQVIERHLMEGIFAAKHHPSGATALDFGSGTGIPGIPIAICRPGLSVVLAESQRKKAAFLQEVVRRLGLPASVHAGRAETLPIGSFDAVWMRAVDKGTTMLPAAAALVAKAGSLCLFGTGIAPSLPSWRWKTLPFPGSTGRVLHIAQRA